MYIKNVCRAPLEQTNLGMLNLGTKIYFSHLRRKTESGSKYFIYLKAMTEVPAKIVTKREIQGIEY